MLLPNSILVRFTSNELQYSQTIVALIRVDKFSVTPSGRVSLYCRINLIVLLVFPYTFHFFGNTLNLPDNIKNSSDNIVIFSELRVPTNTTDKNFTITFKKSYTSIDGPKQQMEEDNFLIIRPQLNAIEITSAQ